MKLRLLAAAMAVLAAGSGAALAQTAAPAPAAAAAPDKTTLSYAIGYDMARDLAERKVDLDMATMIRGINDGYAKKQPAMPGDKLAAALSGFQKKMADQERANFEKLAREKSRACTGLRPFISAMSAPATKAFGPAPVRMTTRTEGSAAAASKAACSSAIVSWLRAFNLSGRLRLIVRIPSLSSTIRLRIGDSGNYAGGSGSESPQDGLGAGGGGAPRPVSYRVPRDVEPPRFPLWRNP